MKIFKSSYDNLKPGLGAEVFVYVLDSVNRQNISKIYYIFYTTDYSKWLKALDIGY